MSRWPSAEKRRCTPVRCVCADACVAPMRVSTPAIESLSATPVGAPTHLAMAEVEHLHVSASLHYYVLRLNVAMNDSGSVRRAEPCGNLRRNPHRFAPTERPARETITQCLAFDQFSDDEMKIVAPPDFMNRDDIRMLERRDGVCFLLEALHALSV